MMRPSAQALLLLTSALCLLPATGRGEDKDQKAGTYSLYLENDLFAGTDRYYTSGIKAGWSSADLERFSDSVYASPLLPLIDRLPYINDKEYQKNLLISVGQNIYTPDNTESYELQKDDRPYAGWLYLGVGVAWKNATVRHTLVLDIGVVGSWSFAQETQRLVHDLRGFDHPNGFDNQLHNELGFTATYEREWRWPRHERRAGLNWELLPHAGLALGNVAIYANLGGELRAGLNLPDDFGTPGIAPAATTSTPVEGRQAANRSRFDFGLYVFARADGRAIGRDIFLDGNTFGSSQSVNKRYFVADISVGTAVNYGNTKLAYAVVYRTQEFEGQKGGGQLFGTVSLNVTF